jgi:hypothetical protein
LRKLNDNKKYVIYEKKNPFIQPFNVNSDLMGVDKQAEVLADCIEKIERMANK